MKFYRRVETKYTMPETITSFYSKNIDKYKSEYDRFNKQGKRLTLYRLIWFIGGFISLYFAALHSVTLVIIELLIFVGGFIQLVRAHSKNQHKKEKAKSLLLLNQNERKALNGDYTAFESGAEFIDLNHRYSDDLDLFGKESIYQMLNRCISHPGKTILASFLNEGLTDKKQITERQEAIKDLAHRTTFRQDFATTISSKEESKSDKKELIAWLEEKHLISDSRIKYLLFAIPVVTITLLLLTIFSILNVNLFILYIFIVPLGIIGSKYKAVNVIQSHLSKKSAILLKYSKLLKLIEEEEFNADYLKKITHDEHQEASAKIKQLSLILTKLDYRLNIFVSIFLNAFLLWDLHIVWAMEKWKDQNKGELEQWFLRIGMIDALNSLANYSFNNPGYTFPKVSEKPFELNGEALGHPMLSYDTCITNDVTIKNEASFVVITGANMAGKSTYLRTVGVNLVLAMTGAPVFAKNMIFSPVSIFSSIRTKDSLQKHESYFYAELRRLKEIIDTLQAGEHLFIILDEILKGTNSKDKQNGSIALLKQLISLKASGMIATHDLNLGDLILEYPQFITNKCFEVEIVGNQLSFDYKLKNGVSRNLNASFLMRKMGIGIMDD